jgi:hypothetical protein
MFNGRQQWQTFGYGRLCASDAVHVPTGVAHVPIIEVQCKLPGCIIKLSVLTGVPAAAHCCCIFVHLLPAAGSG